MLRTQKSLKAVLLGIVLLGLLWLSACAAGDTQGTPSPEVVVNTCPCVIMYEGEYYYYGSPEYLESEDIERLREVGTIQSAVPITGMPKKDFETNLKDVFLGQTIWEKDSILYIYAENSTEEYIPFARREE